MTPPEWLWRYLASSDARRVRRIVAGLESEFDLQLSPGARYMILVPVVEALYLHRLHRDELRWSQIERSITDVFLIMREDPDPREFGNRRSSLSVIRAFWKRFCRIPPFCARATGREG